MKNLKNKNIVVFGLGVSGLSAIRLLSAIGANIFAINAGEVNKWYNEIKEFCPIENAFAENDLAHQKILEAADLLILSPGIPRDHKILNPIHQNKIPIWGEIELAYQVLIDHQINLPIIAITGTNGKTTTTTFLGEVLKKCGHHPFIGGNIGIPYCDMALEVFNKKCSYTHIVLELSSFQLESTIEFHPNIAMILNIFQNHGERYNNILDYAQAKFNIALKMNEADTMIIPSDFSLIKNWANTLKTKVIEFDSSNPKVDYDLTNYKLPGLHNVVNLKFITIVGELLHLDRSLVQKAINEFRGVHHRIEWVETQIGFQCFNDAKSTNWDATIIAVKAMEKIPGDLYLIIGGKKRGHGDSILPYLEQLNSRVKKFFLIGEMALELEKELAGKVDYINAGTIDDTVTFLINEKFSGILLLSPAFPSFDQFLNYAKRGEHFIKCVTR